MTNTIVTTNADAVKTVEELEIAWRTANEVASEAFGLLLDHDFDARWQHIYNQLSELERIAYHEWQAALADEEARIEAMCAAHDAECDVEYPSSYEDPIPYLITEAGASYLDRHSFTSSQTGDIEY